MDSLLKCDYRVSAHDNQHLNRLNLARKAIIMLYEKLTDDDVFSLVTFHNKAKTIIKSAYRKHLDPEYVRKTVY